MYSNCQNLLTAEDVSKHNMKLKNNLLRFFLKLRSYLPWYHCH